jgi:myosin heavy subunit
MPARSPTLVSDEFVVCFVLTLDPAEGFLEKNRDTLPLDIIACMLEAEKDLVQTIFDNDDPDDPKERAKNRAKAKKEAKKSLRKKVVGVCIG